MQPRATPSCSGLSRCWTFDRWHLGRLAGIGCHHAWAQILNTTPRTLHPNPGTRNPIYHITRQLPRVGADARDALVVQPDRQRIPVGHEHPAPQVKFARVQQERPLDVLLQHAG